MRNIRQALPLRRQAPRSGVALKSPTVGRPVHATPPAAPPSRPDPAASAAVAPKASAELVEVAHLLAGIRRALGLTEIELAARLAISLDIVRALETGRPEHLPPWQQGREIVGRWISLAGLDPRPALAGLERACAALAQPGAKAPPGNHAKAPPGGAPAEPAAHAAADPAGRTTTKRFGPWRGRILQRDSQPVARPIPARRGSIARRTTAPLRALLRRLTAPLRRHGFSLAAGLPPSRPARWAALVLMVTGLLTAAAQTRVVAGAVAALPAPAERAVRSISGYLSIRSIADALAVRFAPVRQGHRWIEVSDPRSRRGDKLRTGRHSD